MHLPKYLRNPVDATAVRKQAARLLAELNTNVDDWYADRIDYDTFGARQRVTWDAIHAAGPAVEKRVQRALRDQLKRR